MELIDKEKALKDLNIYKTALPEKSMGLINAIINIIHKQPTVNTWISVEDRLPDKSGKYLIYCDRWSKVADEMMKDIKLTEWLPDEKCFEYETGWCADFPKPEVIAWMPIPEYSKENKNERFNC